MRIALVLSLLAILGTMALIEAQTNEGLDTACIALIRRPESTPPAEVTVAKAELDRLSGNYMQTEMGLLIKMETADNRLRATVLKGAPFPPSTLIPVSPTCFRWEGEGLAPGLAGVFHVGQGKDAELTVVQPGKPEVVMKRTPGAS